MDYILATIYLLSVGLMIASPLLRRYNMASAGLAGGAGAILATVFIGLTHVDARIGQAAIHANRRFYLLILACELPVFVLALISWRSFKPAFWLGWILNALFTVYLIVVFVWLEFFWHW